MNTKLTQARLKELLEYNPDTGVFTRKKTRGASIIGGNAGCIDVRRWGGAYVKISIDNILHYAHRLAFLYMTGLVPDEIDHINRDGTDNSWSNLRKICRTSNLRNRGRYKNSKSGITGVRIDRAKWIAIIVVNGERRRLYRGTSRHDAILARYRAEVELGWHESNSDTDAKRYVESLAINQHVQP